MNIRGFGDLNAANNRRGTGDNQGSAGFFGNDGGFEGLTVDHLREV